MCGDPLPEAAAAAESVTLATAAGPGCFVGESRLPGAVPVTLAAAAAAAAGRLGEQSQQG